jgi:AbiV family abortive infection protein
MSAEIEELFIRQQKIGIEFSKQNSNNLYNSAVLLAGNQFYSPAIPTLVLSAEEIIKSFALCLQIFLGNESEVKKIIKASKIKENESYMNNHLVKHKLASAIIIDLNKISPVINFIKLLPLGIFRDVLNVISIPNTERTKIDSLLNELNDFNTKKNKGFYVDYKENNWHTPLKFTVQDYNNVLQNVNLLRDIFLPKITQIQNFSDAELANIYGITKDLKLNDN